MLSPYWTILFYWINFSSIPFYYLQPNIELRYEDVREIIASDSIPSLPFI